MCEFREKRLNPGHEREYLSCLRALQAEGICVDIPGEWLERSSCPLDVVIAPPPVSMVFDWPSGNGAGYAVSLRLLSRGRCMIDDCAITVSWDDHIVIQSLDECKSRCEFGKVVVPPESVLNHRIENTLRFPRAGHLVQGVILGRGVSPIPEQYAGGVSIPFTLTLYDQFGDEISQQGHLSVGERARKRTTVERPTEDLYGNPLSGSADIGGELPARISPGFQPGSSTQSARGKGRSVR